MFVAGIEIKTSTKHVEAATDVVSGRGFKSPRLHSTRCARSWRANELISRCGAIFSRGIRESNALSKCQRIEGLFLPM